MPYQNINDPEKLKSLLDAALSISAGLDLDVILDKFVVQATRLVGARYGALGVLNRQGTGLVKFVTTGLSKSQIKAIGEFPKGAGVLGLLITNPEPILLADISSHESSVGFPPGHPEMKSFLGVPITIRGTVYGNLYLTDKIDGPEFTSQDQDMIVSLSLAAAITIENYFLHERVSELTVIEDRERIARDLHDTAIQRIFATGLSLQSTLKLVQDETSKARIEESIDGLDETIRLIRTAIFSLESGQNQDHSDAGPRIRVLDLCEEASRSLGFQPVVQFMGPLDHSIPQVVTNELVITLREALSNVARHAKASSVSVELSYEGGELIAQITDNGRGIDPTFATTSWGPLSGASKGKGIANMCSRAESLGGTCVVHNQPRGGTRVLWRVPI